jgi:site-specific recombinase XerD
MFAHLMRHSLGTHLVMDGWNIVHVRDKLRHTNISVTSVYTHSNPETQLAMTDNIGQELVQKR